MWELVDLHGIRPEHGGGRARQAWGAAGRGPSRPGHCGGRSAAAAGFPSRPERHQEFQCKASRACERQEKDCLGHYYFYYKVGESKVKQGLSHSVSPATLGASNLVCSPLKLYNDVRGRFNTQRH